jgi:Mannosyltransferase (PIG-V)
VNTLPDVRGARPGVERRRDEPAPRHLDTPTRSLGDVVVADPTHERLRLLAGTLRFPLGIYLISRVLCMVVALVDMPIQHWPLWEELMNWDGAWYMVLTVHGYPSAIPDYLAAGPHQTTLGFFPLYPILIWGLGHVLSSSYLVAGMIISFLTGAIATVLVGRLAAGWWGEQAARRAVIIFCLFPGSIVFSMIYTEGLMLSLVAGCLLALQQRRWLVAGVLAGLATAVGPTAVAIVPACAAAAVIELRRHGWHDRDARRALLAPLLAPVGMVAFASYLWIHTGSPLATYQAQNLAWKETSSPFALVHLVAKLFSQIFAFDSLHHPGINLNFVAGVAGAVFLLAGLWLLWKERARVPVPALVWTFGLAVVTLTSFRTPPNARMLICAFPVLMVVAHRVGRRGFIALATSCTVLLITMSFVSFVGTGLRP